MVNDHMSSIGHIKRIHFVGIGGISMSGLAEICLKSGRQVSGSDMRQSSLTEKLSRMGAVVFTSHDAKNVEGAELVVYTAAVKSDNPEIIRARDLKIPVMERSEFLGKIMKEYSYAVGISGCHGKTSTTGMVSVIFQDAGVDPTILLGGELGEIGGNARVGQSDYFITEACEYVESFLKFYPTVACILNIEEDHLDYFKDIHHIISAFTKFAQLVPEEGCVIFNRDDPYAPDIAATVKCPVLSFGILKDADFKAYNIVHNALGHPQFDVSVRGEYLGSFELHIPGNHNVSNALAAIAISHHAGLSMDTVKESLKKYRGTGRRFDIKGKVRDITVVDDYAHHPTEIKATLESAKEYPHNKIWCIFEPHTYTRTKAFLEDFANSFHNADHVIVTDIYAAREPNTGAVHARDLVAAINKNSGNAIYISDFHDIAHHISQNGQPGDLVLTVGAGDITKLGPIILDTLG